MRPDSTVPFLVVLSRSHRSPGLSAEPFADRCFPGNGSRAFTLPGKLAERERLIFRGPRKLVLSSKVGRWVNRASSPHGLVPSRAWRRRLRCVSGTRVSNSIHSSSAAGPVSARIFQAGCLNDGGLCLLRGKNHLHRGGARDRPCSTVPMPAPMAAPIGPPRSAPATPPTTAPAAAPRSSARARLEVYKRVERGRTEPAWYS